MIFTAILLLFATCKKSCLQKRPKDVKPIDWENYNDVYDVFWNYNTFCSETKEKDRGKEIMICGWIFHGWNEKPLRNGGEFVVISNEKDIFEPNFSTSTRGTGICVRSYYGGQNECLLDSLRIKFDTTDITKKCFIKGILIFKCLHTEKCSKAEPEIILEDINNICFEK